jgi:DNA recombination protein RmuC
MSLPIIILLSVLVALLAVTLIVVFLQRVGHHLKENILEKLAESSIQQQQAFNDHRSRFDERQMEALKILQDTLQKGMADTRFNVKEALSDYAELLGKRVDGLTQTTDLRLKEINQQVEKRLADGFEKTNETFTDVIKRLALIDVAQQKITELSTNVISLQEILNDKRSRGAFGEVQLAALIRNVIPEQHFSLQHTLSNKTRVDCILWLPEPTGNIGIDAKFPLENYRLLSDTTLAEAERLKADVQFKKDIRYHIKTISEKYIIDGETADGAIMFIPAEAVFAEIHARHPDLVEASHRAKVWMVSPTTMMAILTTARAVLKDTATRQQLNIIQEHLRLLAGDFKRFQKRMDDVAQHIAKAHSEVDDVQISAKKISARFGQIEKVELESLITEALPPPVPIEADDSI